MWVSTLLQTSRLLICFIPFFDLVRNPTLRVSYIDTESQKDGYTQYGVLMRGVGTIFADGSHHPNPSEDKYTVEEVYRVRFPKNAFTGRGIIIGEGKPENQNHGECRMRYFVFFNDDTDVLHYDT